MTHAKKAIKDLKTKKKYQIQLKISMLVMNTVWLYFIDSKNKMQSSFIMTFKPE